MAIISKCDILYLIFSIIGVISGLSGCVVFLFVYRNIQASIWAFVSGTYAATYLFLLILKVRDLIDEWYGTSHLFRVAIFGGLGSVASIIAFVAYVCLAITHREEFPSTKDDMRTSHIIMAVWAALSIKWSITLIVVAKHISQMLRGGYISI